MEDVAHLFAQAKQFSQPIACSPLWVFDRQIQQLSQTDYPETQALRKVPGVGDLTALTFVLTLGSKERFKQSRDVGCYLGLRP